MKLVALGWSIEFGEHFEAYAGKGFTVGRIAVESKEMYKIYTEHGEVYGQVSGKMRFEAEGRGDFPAVGDWVVMKGSSDNKAVINAILPRKSKFSRKVAGAVVEEQIVAANMDTVFIMSSLNNDFNPRRIERYLILAWESGANPVIVLSKADLADDIDRKVAEIESIAPGVPIHVISSLKQEGIEALAPYLTEGKTVAILGSSGVGKSTLINCLIGNAVQEVKEVREGDDRGKHTTTYRELFLLENGAVIIDTPGMRELQLWEADDGLQNTFGDIEDIASECAFRDCTHTHEPGCAVQASIISGKLDSSRYASYRKMQRELTHLSQKMTSASRKLEKRRADKEKGRQHAKFRPEKNLY